MNNQPSEKQSSLVQEARRAYSHSLMNLAIYGFFFQFAINLLAVAARAARGGEPLPILLRYAIQFGIMYAVGLPLYLFLSKGMPVSPPKKEKLKVGHFLMIVPCLLCVMYLGNLFGMFFNWLIAKLIGINTESTALQDNVYGEYGFVMVLAAVFLAPFVEEMLFRKVLIDRVRKYGDRTAILLSGIFFGLFHGNFTQFFYTAMAGLLLAFVYVRTGRTIYTILLHMIINFCGGALPYLTNANDVIQALRSQNVLAILRNTPFMFYVITVIGLAVVGMVLLIAFRNQFHVDEPETPLPKGTARYAVAGNIGFWALVLFCAYDFVMQIAS